jgi:protein-S-isoprenylcysteine O-methyltransferase Ste14
MKNNNPSDNIKTNSLLKIIVRVLMIFIFLGLLLFLTAGSANYNEAWIYILSLFLTGLFVIGYFYKKDPEFIGGRILKRREKEETSKSIQNILSIPIFIGLLIPGLDYRFGWSDVPLSLVIISVVFVLAGYMIIARVMEENRYASSIIEISNEQKVIESGPYKIIRHPMYTGGLLFTIFTPLALGSYWALISFSATSVLGIILRIINEEKFLKANLQGYDEYCRKTKYRLIPFLW